VINHAEIETQNIKTIPKLQDFKVAFEEKKVKEAQDPVSFEVKDSVVDWGKYIVLNWRHTGQPFPTDWIALYKTDEPQNSTNYITWEYVVIENNSKFGTLSFQAPYASGSYEFRYFVNKSYTIFGISKPFKVGPQYDMKASVVSQNNKNHIQISLNQTFVSDMPCTPYIAIYAADKLTHSEYYDYRNVSDGTILFAVPKSGKWFFRLFADKYSRYNFVAACEIVVHGKDSINLQQTQNDLIVKFDLESIDFSYESPWIGLYETKVEGINSYEQGKYLYQSKGEFKMAKLRKGEWEARLFSKTQYNVPIVKSNVIVVQL